MHRIYCLQSISAGGWAALFYLARVFVLYMHPDESLPLWYYLYVRLTKYYVTYRIFSLVYVFRFPPFY